MKTKILLFICALSAIIVSCRREFETSNPEVIREWYVPFSSQFTNPAVAGRPDTGTVHIQLLENNSIRYDFNLTNFRADDLITGVSLNAGSPIANGPVLVNLNSRLGNKYITGVAQNLRQSLVDSLRDTTNQIYFTANSSLAPNGIFRGQLNETITLAATVALTGAEEVPPVTTTARGTAIIRVTSNRKVYSLVSVTNVEPTDQMTMAHIHNGGRGQNGPILVTLVNAPTEFGIAKTIFIDDATYNTLMNNPLYVNAHSVRNPAGKIRGQLK
jgi:hypothetical protein